jgi:HPt (histidine-containing phosphotransfer) domain-containing protein
VAEKAVEHETAELGFLDALNNIEEVNTVIGLNNFSGVEDMYRETFELFYRNLARECEDMSRVLNDNDLHKFSISVHAMKSALATVGIVGLSETALGLEMASKSNKADFCTSNFPDFKEKLLLLEKELHGIFPDLKVQNQKKAGNAAMLHESVQKALAAAADFDNYAGIEEIQNLLSYSFGAEITSSLEKAIKLFEELDFDGAKEILNKMDS